MNRIFHNSRRCRTPFNANGVRSSLSIGYDGRASDLNLVHRCLMTKTTTTKTNGIWQRRRHLVSFQNPPSQFQQLHHHKRLQVRHFVYDSRKARKSKTKKDPFKVLKVPKESMYKDVKAKFLKIAMNNHPDKHTEGVSEKEQEAMRDKFIAARMAFERLQEDPSDGTTILVEELIDRDKNFDSWFKDETGLKNPFDLNIDPETMKEVAEMTEKLGGKQGMDRDGGSKCNEYNCAYNPWHCFVSGSRFVCEFSNSETKVSCRTTLICSQFCLPKPHYYFVH